MEPPLDYVLRTVEERGVRFVRLWFTDVLGKLKSFAITPVELEGALEEGMTFDGSAIEGYTRVQEADMLAKPDPGTFEIVRWRGEDAPVARMFCDIHRLDGEPFEGDPRHVLKRNLERAREKGFTFYAGPEMEFFYFKSSRAPEPLDSATYFDLTQMDMVSELRKQTILTLEAMGIPVEYSFHELGPSQHEIDLRYTDALTMADNVMTFRLVVKEVAQDLGVYATFMPKPISGAFGSGMHTHLSLFEGDVNAFHAPDPACNPYLAFSVMLAAGLKGIEEGYELPPEATNNIYEMTPEERAAEGIGSLPQSLTEAISAMEQSELVADALGEHVFDY